MIETDLHFYHKMQVGCWCARQDLNLHAYAMEPKSIVSANSTTGADRNGRKSAAILLSSDFYTARKPRRSITLDPQL